MSFKGVINFRKMSKNINIKSFPASYGESFLIKCKSKTYTTNILIDAGFLSTAKIVIEELKKINLKGQKLDLLIFTHIDNDHINGAREVLKEITENKIIEIGEIWYNDYFKMVHLVEDTKGTELQECNDLILNQILNRPYPCEKGIYKKESVSFGEAQYLEQYLLNEDLKSIWNKSFDYGAIFIDEELIHKNINSDVSIVVLNPTFQILSKQFYEWRNYLRNKGFNEKLNENEKLALAFEQSMISEAKKDIVVKNLDCAANNNLFKECMNYNVYDDKITNRTSISIVLEFDGKRLMFLGDGSPIELEESINRYVETTGVRELDLIKIPHHGSKNNWSTKLNGLVHSEKYLIATNGKVYKHPDIETIVKLIGSYPKYTELYFNYKPQHVMRLLQNIPELLKRQYGIIWENKETNGVRVQEIEL